jgi:hypothetical protein
VVFQAGGRVRRRTARIADWLAIRADVPLDVTQPVQTLSETHVRRDELMPIAPTPDRLEES